MATTETLEEFTGEIYTDAPDDLPRAIDDRQDAPDLAVRTLVAPTQRDTNAALAWYRDEATSPPFDPDGMCLKVCRTARNIGPMFPSAVSAQVATPMAARREAVANVRRGMVAYYDDPNDDNPFGHIVTVAGRAPGEDPSTLRSLIVWTNSVKANVLVAVRGDYFPTHWGDEFRFGATWLNGQDLNLPTPPRPKLGANFTAAVESLEAALAYHRRKGHGRIVTALERDLAELRETLKTING
jgi:hypothetical protein